MSLPHFWLRVIFEPRQGRLRRAGLYHGWICALCAWDVSCFGQMNAELRPRHAAWVTKRERAVWADSSDVASCVRRFRYCTGGRLQL